MFAQRVRVDSLSNLYTILPKVRQQRVQADGLLWEMTKPVMTPFHRNGQVAWQFDVTTSS